MAIEHFYNVYIGTTPPAKPIGGWIWIHPVIGQAYIYIIDSWKPFAGDEQIADFIDGKSYWLETITQEDVPTGIDAPTGKIWLKPSVGQAYIKLNGWISFAGG